MARPVAERAFDQDALSYGYGVIIEDVDGHTYLAHDNDSLQNGPYRVNRSGNGRWLHLSYGLTRKLRW